jgi:dTDP-4-dehydrorhamnose reductase
MMTDRLGTVLVFGAGGQVGRELIQRSAPQGFAVLGLTHADVDIADREAVASTMRRHRPDIIVNAAAYTAVDKAETDLDRAYAVNEAGPRNLALAAKDSGAVLVHLSTDYVFDGCKTDAYVEDDLVAPASAYGRSKEAGERGVRETMPRHLIVRTAWVYAAHGTNFLKTMARLAREREVVGVVADQHGTPTAAADLADALLAILPRLQKQDAAFGTFHLTNAGRTTWHGFAAAIFAGLARQGGRVPRLEAIGTADYPTPARRPAMSVLDCRKIADAYGVKLRPWQEAVEATLEVLLGRELERGGT